MVSDHQDRADSSQAVAARMRQVVTRLADYRRQIVSVAFFMIVQCADD